MHLSRRALLAGLAAMPFSAPALSEPLSTFLDSRQLNTVAAMSETFIPRTDTPGARDAGVHHYIDAILAASPEPARGHFLEGLVLLDRHCLEKHRAPFAELQTSQQNALLSAILTNPALPSPALHQFVAQSKLFVARIYYATEAGQAELNKGGRVPAKYYSD
ncbi:MAG TPA: gluconate 2-dehydrogenase subunit 3 family protein [Bryobacteraceae bacterium]|nr:gluconate 2-dehydrogenase subunit 3 family protein [Bryobacteraceae bacterium]